MKYNKNKKNLMIMKKKMINDIQVTIWLIS